MPEAELAIMIGAARAAGDLALRHFAGSRAATEKAGGLGPVTQADIEVDRLLRKQLLEARPSYGWLSEESEDDPARLNADRVFVVDPIDGTRAFIEGKKDWAISIAVVERGRAIAGIVHMPVLGRSYTAIEGYGAQCNGAAIWASETSTIGEATLLVNGAQMKEQYWPGGIPQLERHFRPSIAYRMCLAAEGKFDGMLTFRNSFEWDIAAGDIIAREAGAIVTDRNGNPTVYNNPTPTLPGIFVAGRFMHRYLMERSARD
ncbi:3'(2'),5'-bisphosphate nucleotidase CysQ [Amaricoccus tamworthensis]|uniref:3'(2'),5'-bisphosphate nucleotidase CysQ n=1 Tax=Amaricoccus tamworthensis TaxID=57002 RepID=UPI003C7C93D9